MARGGARLNAGAKSKWKHGKTKTIRVPEVLADQIIEYALALDNQKEVNLYSSNTLNLAGVHIYMSNKRRFIYISDLIKHGYNISPQKLASAVSTEDSS